MALKEFEILTKTRKFVLSLIDGLTTAQLNHIPEGFNNNIIWNLAHMVAAQEGVCYARAGMPVKVGNDFFDHYKPGTKPVEAVGEDAVNNIKALLLKSIDTLQEDYTAGAFKSNPAWTNRYGVEHETIEDSITFLVFHDGLHIGVIMGLKKLVDHRF